MHGTGVSLAQRALLGTIDDGLDAVDRAQDALGARAQLPPLGDDAVSIASLLRNTCSNPARNTDQGRVRLQRGNAVETFAFVRLSR